MARPLRYADAVRLLGGNGPVFDALNHAVGGAFTAATGSAPDLVLSLLGADAGLARLSRSLVTAAAERIRGLGRFERTERMAAAHAVIVVAAYSDAMSRTRLPFDVRELATGRGDSVRSATGTVPDSRRLDAVADHLLGAELPLPSPHEPYETTLAALRRFYVSMSRHTEEYVSGLAVWEGLAPRTREEARTVLRERVPDAAMTCYEEMFRQLAADFPDVGIWADRVDHQATRHALRGLEETVTRLAETGLPPGRLAALRRAGALLLDAPVLGAEDSTEGMVIPSLREAYVSLDFRVAGFTATDRLTSEEWWQEQPVRTGLEVFLEGLLTAPRSVEAPILLLGVPGSGKSLLTKVLAARLPERDFLAVRVPLRDVPADSGVQDQIEAAIRQATGERLMDWADLVRAAAPALPVVLLDGFDELLQATGTNQSDYLEQVANFQRREADLDRPLAVVLTSRTVVADRARLTPGGIGLRIEPFSPAQTGRWLRMWNDKNAAYFRAHRLRPLTSGQVLAQRDLAGQPLLLLMLALYDAEENAYQREVGTLAGFELYERLLVRFAHREVLKHTPQMVREDVGQAVEYELLRLSVAAFGMFNRGRQWVTDDELESDLCALLTWQPRGATGLRTPLSGAQTTFGRFFFIHRAEALREEARLRSYEFLHATFGEFLVARLIVHELRDLLRTERAEARRARRSHTDDAFLRALLSFAACAGRGPVVTFLTEALRRLPQRERQELRQLLLRLFHESLTVRGATPHAAYQPRGGPAPAAPAYYRANLLVLLLAFEEEIPGRDLFPAESDPVDAWRSTMLLLESQLSVQEWRALADLLCLHRGWEGDERAISVELEDKLWFFPPDDDPRVVDPYWTYGGAPGSEFRNWVGWLYTSSSAAVRDAHLRCEEGTDALLHLAQGLDDLYLELALTSYGTLPDGTAMSGARMLLRLWSAGGEFSSVHRDAMRMALKSFAPDEIGFTKRYLSVVLRQWELAGHPVPLDWVERAHSLIEAQTSLRDFDSLLDELPRPPD